MILCTLGISYILQTTIYNLNKLKEDRGKYSNKITLKSNFQSAIKATKTTNSQLETVAIPKTKILNKISFKMSNNFNSEEIVQLETNNDNVPSTSADSCVIDFNGSEFYKKVLYKNVNVVCGSGKHDHGSSRVKLKNIVDYKWEHKYYPGHLVALHLDGTHIAYVINVNNKSSRVEGMIRVSNAVTGMRTLIKGLGGAVLDIQFAHIEKEHILGSIDANSLYVHKIDMLDGSLLCNLLVKIEDPLENYTPKYDRILWCPFIEVTEEDEEETEDSKLIVWARGSKFQCFNIGTIITEYGVGQKDPKDFVAGYLNLHDETLTISWTCLSPDGSTLGIGSIDGFVRFYQVYMHEQNPRCLHQWKPHDGKPISCFYFLDNLATSAPESYWKYAITGADSNTELKVWDCGTWECIQKITFTCEDTSKTLRLIAELDRTSRYLVLSSLDTRACYVLQIVNLFNNQCKKDENELSDSSNVSSRSSGVAGAVYVRSITEFPLSSGILSFCIHDAAVRRLKCSNDNYLCEEMDDYDEEMHSLYCVVVRMFVVQSKSLQECHILYQPQVDDIDIKEDIDVNNEENIANNLNISEDLSSKQNVSPKTENVATNLVPSNVVVKPEIDNSEEEMLEALLSLEKTLSSGSSPLPSSVVAVAAAAAVTPSAIASEHSGTSSPQNGINSKNYVPVNLMTPDEFASTSAAIDGNMNRNIIDTFASGGSSPSREVQEILSFRDYKTNAYSTDEMLVSEEKDEVKINLKETEPRSSGTPSKFLWANTPKEVQTTTSTELQKAVNLIPKTAPTNNLSNNNHPTGHIGHSSNTISNSSSSNTINTANGVDHLEDPQMLAEILELNKTQARHITALKEEIAEIKNIMANCFVAQKQLVECTQKQISDLTYKIDVQIPKVVENISIRNENESKKRLAAIMKEQNIEMGDKIMKSLSQLFATQLTPLIAKTINVELQRNVGPLITGVINNMQSKILIDLTRNLAKMDAGLKETLVQLCKSKSVIEAFSKSILVAVQDSLQNAFIESMSGSLIPAYEKSSQHMFKQLHEAFSYGIKEFMEQFENYMQETRQTNERAELFTALSALRQHIENALLKHHHSIGESLAEGRKDVKSMEIIIARQVKEAIRIEMRKISESQNMQLRSQTNTPAPMYDIRESIKLLLQSGQINKAFHQALLANDLSLVDYTLRNTDPSSVFIPACCLEQKVLLSLIQQISADMPNHSETKQRYLAEAILSIDFRDAITREHAPKVLQELLRNIQMFIVNYPKSPLVSNVRLLLTTVQACKEKF
ncbi:enhancer of mRNA-decapping protein 4 homolog isoform X2 [Teleopsis dalmanni]|uniref:enhancer of mRNA-decapping protein 4 homolog isoform X2 n=1 Tax=Teleopsis dalmanni TaxID=139649 RepID=UPI0018CF6F86|nr:enhancer of mRNA-decapping protein 4 homolog isoform X2 [Teleopsis dalmanni]